MAIVRLYQGEDGRSHFEDIEPELEPLEEGWPQDARAVIHGGIVVQRFDPERSNPWHHAPGQVAVFTLTGSVEIEVGNGDKRVIGPGDVLIAEDVAGEGHYTREVGPEARISIFVPLREHSEV